VDDVASFLIRTAAFLGKEIFEILRQPVLVLTLILGPFLILLLFGLGFHNDPQALRTMIVAPETSGLAEKIKTYAASLGPQFIFVDVTNDKAQALEKLLNRQVDVVAVVPADTYETLSKSEQVVLNLYYYEIDPILIQYMDVFGRVYVHEVNRRVLRNLIEQEQGDAATIHDTLSQVRQSADRLHEVLLAGDRATIRQEQQRLSDDLNTLTAAVGATTALLDSVQQMAGADHQDELQAIHKILAQIRKDTNTLGEIKVRQGDFSSQENNLKQVEDRLTELDSLLAEFRKMKASVLVSPFRSQTKNITPVDLRPLDFFTPSVIVLLLQHLSVTFAALSIVGEQEGGTIELFQVAPLSALETLLGKYLSYFLFAGILAAILTALVTYALGVPMLGGWFSYSLSLAAVVFASLGIGFVVSLVAQTDSQAVQFSMITLLATVFFSGAFMNLHMLEGPVRLVSWTLPATYGILLLQNIMLRGSSVDMGLLASLAAIGVGLFIMALWLLRRRMSLI
jgi:ABC-2 type transport system permease protein